MYFTLIQLYYVKNNLLTNTIVYFIYFYWIFIKLFLPFFFSFFSLLSFSLSLPISFSPHNIIIIIKYIFDSRQKTPKKSNPLFNYAYSSEYLLSEEFFNVNIAEDKYRPCNNKTGLRTDPSPCLLCGIRSKPNRYLSAVHTWYVFSG